MWEALGLEEERHRLCSYESTGEMIEDIMNIEKQKCTYNGMLPVVEMVDETK